MFKSSTAQTKHLAILFALACSSPSAFAATNQTFHTNILNYDLGSSLGNKPSNSEFSGDFLLRSNQVVEDVGEVTGNQYWGDLNLKYETSSTSVAAKKKATFSSRVNDEGQFMFSVPEAYIKREWSDSSLAFGRSVLDWGYIDAVWGFGKINNRKNFDFFEPGVEGLTGLLYEKESGGMKFSLFGSLVYVPELNPGQEYDEDKGTVTCKNAWCRPQAQTAPIDQGVEVPIFYDIDYPDTADIVFRYSAGARISLDMGLVDLEVFGIRKPENQLSVAAEYYYSIDEQTAFVDVTPQVYYHDVLGANLTASIGERFKIYGGGLSITPNTYPDGIDPKIQYTGLKPKKKKEEYLATGAFYNDGQIRAGLHYVARVSDYDLENDLMVEYPRWNQAVNFNISTFLTRKLSVAFDHKFDMLTEDRLTMFSASYLVSANTLASMGVNVIGAEGDVESFWSEYSNNDSVYGSLKVRF